MDQANQPHQGSNNSGPREHGGGQPIPRRPRGPANYIRYPVPPPNLVASFTYEVLPVPFLYPPFCMPPQPRPFAPWPYPGYAPPFVGFAPPGNFGYNRPPAPFLYPRVPCYGQQYPRYYYQPMGTPYYNHPNRNDFFQEVQSVPTDGPDGLPSESVASVKPEVNHSDVNVSTLPVEKPVNQDEEHGVFSNRKRSESPAVIPQVSIEWSEEQFKPTIVPEETVKLREISPCNEITKDINPSIVKTLTSSVVKRKLAKFERPLPVFTAEMFPPLVDKEKRGKQYLVHKENIPPEIKWKTLRRRKFVEPLKEQEVVQLPVKEFDTHLENIQEEPKPAALLVKNVHPFFKIKHVFNMFKAYGKIYKISRCHYQDNRSVVYKIFFDSEEEARKAMEAQQDDNLRGFKMKIDFLTANSKETLEKMADDYWNYMEISNKSFP